MAGDEVKRKKTTHRRHGEPRSSKSHILPNDEATATNPPAANDRSPNINALRKARLAHINDSPQDIPEDMKYVYEKRIKTAAHVNADNESRHRTPTERTSERKASKSSHKSKRRTEERARDEQRDESEDDYEYVYPRAAPDKSQGDTHGKSPDVRRRRRPSTSQTVTRKKDESRREPERRHTEPTRERTRRSQNEEDAATPIVKTHTNTSRGDESTSRHERPPLKRSATVAATPKTELAGNKSSEAVTPHSRKPSGILGSFLGPRPPIPQKKVSCLTCGSDDVPISQSAKLPCTHRMCHSCLKRIFSMSVKDPAHMPPRCCTEQHIDLKLVDKLFDDKFKVLWNRKFDEYHTKNRVYCPARKCGAWIKPKYITTEKGRKVGRCKHCKTLVCAICSQKMHTTRDCPKDPETKAFVEVAKQSGWQRCYSCSAMVELKEGCNHMTCRCTAEFCMVCGLKWKSCDCPWFNYETVDAHLGDPALVQQQMDRRRDQETRDEALARRLQRMGMFDAGTGVQAGPDTAHNGYFAFGNGNGAADNFLQQAREALTANWPQAGQAARDLLQNYVIGRENRPAAHPGDVAAALNAMRGQPPQQGNGQGNANGIGDQMQPPTPTRRGTATRRRNAREAAADEQRRLQDWANSVAH